MMPPGALPAESGPTRDRGGVSRTRADGGNKRPKARPAAAARATIPIRDRNRPARRSMRPVPGTLGLAARRFRVTQLGRAAQEWTAARRSGAPAATRRASALSVRSQVNSGSERPK